MQQDDSLLGDWVKDIDSLSQSFSSATPFPHVVIPNFFKTEVAEKLYESFPEPGDQSYHRYWNPLEKKLALNNFTYSPSSRREGDREGDREGVGEGKKKEKGKSEERQLLSLNRAPSLQGHFRRNRFPDSPNGQCGQPVFTDG